MKFGFVRIIAGEWRGRRLKVLNAAGLRPTPDRVRETVFNWLAPVIRGARCLDLFAGSGALGFEALSRGAAYVELVDSNRKLVVLMNEELASLGAHHARVYRAEIPKELHQPQQPFDIVFIDPPYDTHLLFPTCEHLETQNFLAPVAYIYIETRTPLEAGMLPTHWHLLKAQKAGEVAYHLAKRQP